jgi:hypothetical protein
VVILRCKRNYINNDVQIIEYKRNCTDTNKIVVITPSEEMEQLVSNPQIKFNKWDRSKILGQVYRGLNERNQEKYANEVIQNKGRENLHEDMRDIMLRREQYSQWEGSIRTR